MPTSKDREASRDAKPSERARSSMPSAARDPVGDLIDRLGNARASRSLPHRSRLESTFRSDLSNVEVVDAGPELSALGVRGAATSTRVAFAEPQPAIGVVAHEVAHVLQHAKSGQATSAAAEHEAANARHHVEHGGAGPYPIRSAPAAHLQLDDGKPGALDPQADQAALSRAIGDLDADDIVSILQRNSAPRAMYALVKAYGPYMIDNLLWAKWTYTDSQWARIRAYLGDQLPFHLRISTRGGDREGIFHDIQRLPDRQALELFADSPTSMFVVRPIVPDPTPYAIPPGETSRAEVTKALHDALEPNDYYIAMRMVLEKAAQAKPKTKVTAPLATGQDPGDFGIVLVGTGSADLFGLPALGDPTRTTPVFLDSVAEARVDLALDVIRDADTKDWEKDATARSKALLALTELTAPQRQLLLSKLDTAITKNSRFTLEEVANIPDDALMVRTAISYSLSRAQLQNQQVDAVGMQIATQRGGALLAEARGKLDALPKDSPEREAAQKEVDRIQATLFDEQLLYWLRVDKGFEGYLKSLGGDPEFVGAELIDQAGDDFDALIDVLKRTPVSARVGAVKRSGLIARRENFTPDQLELIAAYLSVNRPVGPPNIELVAVKPYMPDEDMPKELPYVHRREQITLNVDIKLFEDPTSAPPTQGDADAVVIPELFAYVERPRVTIALHDILKDLDDDHPGAALARLADLNEDDRTVLYSDDRFRKRVQDMDDGPVRDAFTWAWFDPTLELGVSAVRTRDKEQMYELLGHDAEKNQPRLRRGFVLAHRLAEQPGLQLTDDDQAAVREYQNLMERAHENIDKDDWRDQERLAQITLGQPQLVDTQSAALDPNTEADFMAYRLGERVGARDPKGIGQSIEDVFGRAGPDADEAIARFQIYYKQVRSGGVSRGELAQLAELYHQAMRAIDAFRADNESFAEHAAKVVGLVVIAVVLLVASDGALAPVELAALSALSAGAAEAATGALIRVKSGFSDVAKDFATGAVDGAAMVAGNALAAELVAPLAEGLDAATAAAEAGSQAVTKAVGKIGISIVENAIAGAVANAAGELFQTAIDRATWNRGIAEAFATMLSAVARGAATGAAAGAVISGAIGVGGALAQTFARIAARSGPEIAGAVTRFLEDSKLGSDIVEQLTQADEDAIANAVQHLQAGRYAEAEAILRKIDIPGASPTKLLAAARMRVFQKVTAEIGPLPEGVAVDYDVVPDSKFPGERNEQAVIRIKEGKPRIVIRDSAPPTALREEVIHLSQFYSDVTMQSRMLMLSEENLARWPSMHAPERLQTYIAKLEVEADAQRKIIGLFEHATETDPEALTRALDAEETLFKLDEQLDLARAGKLDLSKEPPPRLFAKGAQSPTTTGVTKDAKAALARVENGASITSTDDLNAFKRNGYVVHEDANGKIIRIARRPGREDLPHLTITDDGTVVVSKRLSFAERQRDAAKVWERTEQDIAALEGAVTAARSVNEVQAAQAALKRYGLPFRRELAKLTKAGTIDTGTAGLLQKWGPALEEAQSRSGGAVSIQRYVDQITRDAQDGRLTETSIDRFRRDLRSDIVDYLKTVEPARQVQTLNDMLDLMPDPGSKGTLFTAFRRSHFEDLVGVEVESAQGFVIGNVTRFPDDVIEISVADSDLPPPGRYALDDKAGPEAFKIDQARDYARMLASNRSGYDGLVYICATEEEAKVVAETIRNDAQIGKMGVKDKFFVTHFNAESGTWVKL